MNININTKGILTEILFKEIPRIKEEVLEDFKNALKREPRLVAMISSWDEVDLTVTFAQESENACDGEYLLFFDVDVENAMSNKHYTYDISVDLPYSDYVIIKTQCVDKINLNVLTKHVEKIKTLRDEINELRSEMKDKERQIKALEDLI